MPVIVEVANTRWGVTSVVHVTSTKLLTTPPASGLQWSMTIGSKTLVPTPLKMTQNSRGCGGIRDEAEDIGEDDADDMVEVDPQNVLGADEPSILDTLVEDPTNPSKP